MGQLAGAWGSAVHNCYEWCGCDAAKQLGRRRIVPTSLSVCKHPHIDACIHVLAGVYIEAGPERDELTSALHSEGYSPVGGLLLQHRRQGAHRTGDQPFNSGLCP